jgi:hypothetical protein
MDDKEEDEATADVVEAAGLEDERDDDSMLDGD